MIALCLKCGDRKAGPIDACPACGALPRLQSELAISLALSDELSPAPSLIHYANEIKNHLRLTVPDSVLAQARAAVAGWQRTQAAQESPTLGAVPVPRKAAPPPLAPAPVPVEEPLRIPLTALHRSPFWILGANARDARRRIVELAEEQSLIGDPELCRKARTDLTNPRTRLTAEIGWLPGVSPRRAEKLMEDVVTSPRAVRAESGLPALAHANLLAAAFETTGDDYRPEEFASFVLEMADVVDSLDVDDIMRDINEDRSVSGFPATSDADVVEGDLVERRRYYKTTIKEALDRLTPAAIITVMTKVVEDATLHGEDQAAGLVDELVDSYEVETQSFLEQEAENARKLLEAARGSAAGGEGKVKPLVDKLERVTRNWVNVAHPIILSAKARGTRHSGSHDLAFSIRSLAIDLFNEHNFLTQSNRITALLQELFEHVPELMERVDKDVEVLQDIFEGRKQSEARRAEWAKEITYEAQIGLVFKETLAISPNGVSWAGSKFPLEAVTRVRWGGVRHSVNGIPSGSTFTIGFGDNRSEAVVETKREEVFSTFVDKLFRAVGVRLLTEMLEALKAGRTLQFGDAEITDDGAILTRRKFLASNERIRVPWSAIQIWSADGSFWLQAKGEKKTDVGMSYISTPNVHLLEQAIRVAFKKPGVRKLSDLLADD